MLGSISHPGTVVDVKEDCIKVRIESVSACAACHIKGVCTTADKSEKIIDVKTRSCSFCVGDHVEIVTNEAQGLGAVFFAYVVPAALIFFVLFFGMRFALSELVVGGAIIFVLAVYCAILFFLKDHMKKRIFFDIKK